MARRENGRLYHGRQARRILCGMLWNADGIAVRVRSDEPVVGGGTQCPGLVGEDSTIRPRDCARERRGDAGRSNSFDGLFMIDGCRHLRAVAREGRNRMQATGVLYT